GFDQRTGLRPGRGYRASGRGVETARAAQPSQALSRTAPATARGYAMTRDSYIHKVLPGEPGGPLLFVFHGTGGDENQLAALGRDLVPAATVVSPRGDVSEFGAARFFRRSGEG